MTKEVLKKLNEAKRCAQRALDLHDSAVALLRDDQGEDSKRAAQANLDEARACEGRAIDLMGQVLEEAGS